MWDCHSCDPGSNPGPGVQPSVRIPTSTTNIGDIITINRETDTRSIVNQQVKENHNYSSDDKHKVTLSFKNIVVKIPDIIPVYRIDILLFIIFFFIQKFYN